MPTPFMHLHMAEQLGAQVSAELKPLLAAHWPAFLLGSIAPDFQSFCDVPRQATHFYAIPPEPEDYGAFDRLLNAYPALAEPAGLMPDEAVFWAAYGIHLLFDLFWDHQLLTPVFRQADWAEPFVRYNAHNTLLTFLDRRALAALSPTVCDQLLRAHSEGWLPFAPGAELAYLQDYVAAQLAPGAAVQTVEIYARRMGVTPEAFAAQLADENWMETHVFCHVNLGRVETVLAGIMPRGLALAGRYLAPLLSQTLC